MFGLMFGVFAMIWAAVTATVGLTLILVFLVPLLAVAILFRIGFVLFKLTAVLLLLGCAAFWLI